MVECNAESSRATSSFPLTMNLIDGKVDETTNGNRKFVFISFDAEFTKVSVVVWFTSGRHHHVPWHVFM